MIVAFHRAFIKTYRKLPKRERMRFDFRLEIFMRDPFDPILSNHPLRGTYAGYRSINIGGDLRAVYKAIGDQRAIFVTIGTHEQLYS